MTARLHLAASLVVVGTGALWGLYWLPVRRLAELALPGPWGTLAIVATASLLLSPFGIRRRRNLASFDGLAIASIALGGFAFALYSVAFVYGQVAIVILLFFLSPVWSTLIGRLCMGWTISASRVVAMAVGLGGLVLVLGADGGLPVPRTLGDWLGLVSGLLWSVATTGIRARPRTGPAETAFVFAVGGTVGAAIMVLILAPWPGAPAVSQMVSALLWTLGAAVLWWGVSIASLLWAAARLEPARVGILLMSEVLVGVISAVVLAGERLQLAEVVGGFLVIAAGVLEVLPAGRGGREAIRYSGSE